MHAMIDGEKVPVASRAEALTLATEFAPDHGGEQSVAVLYFTPASDSPRRRLVVEEYVRDIGLGTWRTFTADGLVPTDDEGWMID